MLFFKKKKKELKEKQILWKCSLENTHFGPNEKSNIAFRGQKEVRLFQFSKITFSRTTESTETKFVNILLWRLLTSELCLILNWNLKWTLTGSQSLYWNTIFEITFIFIFFKCSKDSYASLTEMLFKRHLAYMLLLWF